MWIDPECWDEHFLFYNISQNFNSLKDILRIHWTLLGPLFKGSAPSAWHQIIDRLKLNKICSILVNKIFTSDVLCLKICPQNEHFSNIDFRPLPSLVKSKIKKNPKTDVHNYNVSSIQFLLIWFPRFSTFGAFVRKPKSEKNLQRAIPRAVSSVSTVFYALNYFTLQRQL